MVQNKKNEVVIMVKLKLSNRINMAPLTRSRASYECVFIGFTSKYYSQRATAGLIHDGLYSGGEKGYNDYPFLGDELSRTGAL